MMLFTNLFLRLLIQSEKIASLLKAANVSVESYWPGLFAKLCEKKNVDDLVMNVGSGGGAAVAVSAPAGGAAGGAAAAAAPAAEEKKVRVFVFVICIEILDYILLSQSVNCFSCEFDLKLM